MKPTDITYDICRHYINDLAPVVNPALYSITLGCLRARNIAGLATCSRHFDWAQHTIDDWRFLRQIEAFFKKNALFVQPEVCASAAESSFRASENTCLDTNLRLRPYINSPYLLDKDVFNKILRMQRYISNVLGNFQPFLDGLPHLVKVTSGATAHASRRNSLPQMKMRLKLWCTQRASKYLKAIYHYHGFKGSLRTRETHRNRVELVPKNWKTDRTIACEPEGNLPLQLAFDRYAKRRLRLFGIDLSDQFCNQKRAQKASIDGTLCTVDFKAASDTISFNVVSWLFPVDWFNYLWEVRTPGFRGVFGNGLYSKFSSMGNGSTFAIETLLFAAACYAVGSKDFSVYGDDVILESERYEDFSALTRFLGFTINEDKTFYKGPFRESCGGDFFNGKNVTPVYVRNVDKRKACLCHIVNTLAGIAVPGGALEAYLLNMVKEFKLPLVPFQESSLSGVWIDPDNARSLGILVRRHGVDFYKAYIAKCKRRSFVDSRGYYLWFLKKTNQVNFSTPWMVSSLSDDVDETSSAPVFDHAYVRKRVCWFKPAKAAPDHLYWWSDLLTR